MDLPDLCPACLAELPAGYDGDHVRIDRAIGGDIGLFRSMPVAEQAEVITTAISRGHTWHGLSQRFLIGAERLRAIAGYPADDFDQQVRSLYDQGLSDITIAARLGVTPARIFKSRTRQKLPSLYGPGGRRREAVAA
jgi:hypothetical protein